MTLRVTVAPICEPVSLAEARRWLRVDDDDTTQDLAITMLIGAMRRQAENLTGRAFIPRTLQLMLPYFPEQIDLPSPPLISVTQITYVDTDGATQTLAANQYLVFQYEVPALITPEYNLSFPSTRAVPNAVTVEYVAGYQGIGSPVDADAYRAALPEDLKVWMQMRIATLYENREQLIVGTIVAELPRATVDGLLDPLVLGRRMF
jgi:uncharacterized phiE125 gp8 family phage protein